MIAVLSSLDRLWAKAHGVAKPMKKVLTRIPVLDVQRKLEDDLRDQIEMLNLKLKDSEEANQVLTDIRANQDLRNAELSAKLEQEQAYRLKQSDNAYELSQAEHRIIKLEKDLTVEVGNRDHFRSLVAQQDAFINEAKRQVQDMKSKFNDQLDARKNEVDHLAKQAVRLNDELAKVKTDNCKFQEQTTRLIDEKRKLEEKLRNLECEGCQTGEQGKYCGGCLGCLTRQAEHAMSEMDKALARKTEELAHEQNVGMFRWQIIEVLAATIKVIKKWPWYRRGKAEYLQTQQRIVDGYHQSIRKSRKEFYKLKNDEELDGVLKAEGSGR
jgi:chromosome segregation ATPase